MILFRKYPHGDHDNMIIPLDSDIYVPLIPDALLLRNSPGSLVTVDPTVILMV